MKDLFNILFSHRLIVLVATVSCMLGGLYIMNTSPPRYLATSRVVLDIIKPDPLTGAVVGSKQVEAYIQSQMRVIGDIQIAAQVVETLGWVDDPDLQQAYSQRPITDTRSFTEWIAQRIISRTGVHPVPDTNILEISYWADTPEAAGAIVEALRDAYVEGQAYRLRESARIQADSLEEQAARVRERLERAEGEKAALERVTGVMITDSGSDVENTGLNVLAGAEGSLARGKQSPPYGLAERRLLQLDMTIAAAGALGPNNPQLQALMQRRAVAAAQAAQERAAAGSTGPSASELLAQGLSSRMSKVTAQRVDVTRLRMIQDEVKLRREDYNRLMDSSGRARELSRAAQANVTPLAGSVVPDRPHFPRPEIILGGTLVIGLIVGSLLAMLSEFLERRVRSENDLALATPGAILVVVPHAKSLRTPLEARRLARRPKLVPEPAE